MTQEEQRIKDIRERRTSECNDISVGEAKIRLDFTYLLTALQQANKRVEALEKAHAEARDAILNSRYAMAEIVEDSDQVNAVLSVFDDAFAAALSSEPPQ